MVAPLSRFVVAALLVVLGSLRGQEPLRPNIIYVLADDLGWGDLGCYGQERIQTPHLDALAKEGMRFTQHYAGSTVCAPSRCVLMTGYDTGHAWIRGNGGPPLRTGDVTVAELLRAAGYRTGLAGKWGLGREGTEGIPTRQGFDFFFGYLDQRHAHNYYPTFLVRGEKRVKLGNVVPDERPSGAGAATGRVAYSHDVIVKEALDFIDRHRKERFFLYVALTIPHANNEAGKRGMEVPDLGPYEDKDWPAPQKGMAAMVTRMDRDVGRLLDRLKQHGIDDQTVVMFSSDNGPHREGGNDPGFFDSNGPLRGIKRDLSEGGIRVPFIVRWPGRVKPGTVSEHISGFQDLLPTCTELAGVPAPTGLDGISLLPTLLGKKQKPHPFLYWAFYERGTAQAIREGPWKAISRPASAPLELFNLETDLAEETDIAKDHPGVAARLRRLMAQAQVPSPRWKLK